MLDRILRGALGAALFVGLASCSEQTTSSLGCPSLCSDQSATLKDTVLVGAVSIDTTFMGFPRLGATKDVTLVAQADTSDVRAIIRFDHTGVDSTVTMADSAMLTMVVDTMFAKPTVPVTISAFDVDTTAADTVPLTLLPLFRPDRALGSVTLQPNELKDTVRVPLSGAKLLPIFNTNKRLRVGLQISGVGLIRLRIAGNTVLPFVRVKVSADTTVKPDTIHVSSSTPADDGLLASSLTVYPMVVAGQLPPPPISILAAGGIAGARTYMRFAIPAIVLDSVQVIRATLQLTQTPTRSTGRTESATLAVQPVTAGPEVTDLYTASQFLGVPTLFGIDTLRLVAKDSGQRDIEIVSLVRAWRTVGPTDQPRAIVLRTIQEGTTPAELDFFSTDAAQLSVRPRLRLTYVPRRGFGLP